MTMKTRNAWIGYGFIAPWIIGFIALTLYPAIYSIIISLNDVRLTESGIKLSWRGLYHFNYAINSDLTFRTALGSTVLFIVCATPVVVVFSLIISMLLNNKFPLRTFFRIVFFLPVVIMSGPVISKLLTKHTVTFSEQAPSLYSFLKNLPQIIQTPTIFILDNLVMILWFSGVQILIFLAGLQKISPDLYEAADIDGAGSWEKFWKITLPYMAPIALINTVYTVVEIANYSGMDVNAKITEQLFNQTRIYSFSAAMSWIYFFVIVILLLVIYLIFRYFGRRDG